jgi:hypothetical protein
MEAMAQTCGNYEKLRQPFFGDLHFHTTRSADASTLDTRNTPSDAFHFATGALVGLAPFVDTRTADESPGSPAPPVSVSPHPYCFPGQQCQYTATRTLQLNGGRTLDFAATTDHSEYLGEDNICFWEGTEQCRSNSDCRQTGQICLKSPSTTIGKCVPEGYASPQCILARTEITRLRTGLGTGIFASYITNPFPQRFEFCKKPTGGGPTCQLQAKNVWQSIQQDANAANQACKFTSFIGYEYTATPAMGICSTDHAPCLADIDCQGRQKCQNDANGGGNNLHRDIIFANDDVIDLPISYMEAPTGCGQGADCRNETKGKVYPLASPEQLLLELEAACTRSPEHPHCDFISIPHNSDVSGGAMFLPPANPLEAELRADHEPLAEVFNIKGSSECRVYSGLVSDDPTCNFENYDFDKLNGRFIAQPTPADISTTNFVRSALESGLKYQQRFSVNPFHLGLVGSIDEHNGTPGENDPEAYALIGAHGDASFANPGQVLNPAYFLGLESNPGGLAVAWAEENTRDSIFAALKRREVYATSGTRPIVRFFGAANLPDDFCSSAGTAAADFAAQGYSAGVPMGGSLAHLKNAPTFAVDARMDRGFTDNAGVFHPGNQLQFIQIIKGWVDSGGNTHEAVVPVAGNPNNGATVNLSNCEPQGEGASELCAEWTDPGFNPSQPAFYYARALENPSCRWNQYLCNFQQITCAQPSQAGLPGIPYTQFEYQQCCLDQTVPKTVQQRAVTSPIWYNP